MRAFAYHALARLYCTTGHTAQALVYADKQVELTEASGNDWHAANAHLVRAHILLDDAQTDAAREALQATRRLYGTRMSGLDEGWVVVEEARLALQAGDPDGAIEQARLAIELLGTQSAPGELGDAYLVLARGYDELGLADRAETAYAAAIDALQKQNGWHCELGRAYRWYGKFLRRAGRAEAAMDAFERAADLAPVEPGRPRAPGPSLGICNIGVRPQCCSRLRRRRRWCAPRPGRRPSAGRPATAGGRSARRGTCPSRARPRRAAWR